MTEALPVDNGDLGAMVFGKTEIERVQFKEKSLWTGNENDTGSYQPFGDLFIEPGHTQPQEYRSELDLSSGVQTVSYVSKGVRYRREIIASYPAGVVAMRFTADQPGAFTGKLRLTDMHAQLEGNLGAAAGFSEMLLQSHAGEIHLLPALPKAWPEGKVTGLIARGGFTADFAWENGKVTSYRITSAEPKEVKVRMNGEVKTIRSERF
jgi:alpha-L-fucosidase 2